MKENHFENLAGAQYMNLTSYKSDGTPRPTPVWFAESDGALYVFTGADSYKVRRIRKNPSIRVGPSTAAGESLGPEVEARAEVLPPEAFPEARAVMLKKYRMAFRFFEFMGKLRDQKNIYLRIDSLKID